jgi:uncharacterized protein YyaL (SSP411 family)
MADLVRAANTPFIPSLVLAGASPGDDQGIALLADRPPRGDRATAYVCRGYVCDEPVTDAGALFDQLARVSRATPA